MYEAVAQLDELQEALTVIDAHRPQTAHDWMVASMALRMRIPEVEQGLAVFGAVDTADWPDADWALDLDEAHTRVEESLGQLLVALAVLLEADSSAEERAQWSRHFGRHSRAALEGVDRLRHLLATWRLTVDQD